MEEQNRIYRTSREIWMMKKNPKELEKFLDEYEQKFSTRPERMKDFICDIKLENSYWSPENYSPYFEIIIEDNNIPFIDRVRYDMKLGYERHLIEETVKMINEVKYHEQKVGKFDHYHHNQIFFNIIKETYNLILNAVPEQKTKSVK